MAEAAEFTEGNSGVGAKSNAVPKVNRGWDWMGCLRVKAYECKLSSM